MQIKILDQDPAEVESPLVAVAVFEDDGPLEGAAAALDRVLGGTFAAARDAGDFGGRTDEFLLFYAPTSGGGENAGPGVRPGRELRPHAAAAPRERRHPEHLAACALQLAEDHDFEATVLGPREMEKENMGALLAVAAGSDQEPRLIVLEHQGGNGDDAPLVLVGRGSPSIPGASPSSPRWAWRT
jgi:hypothetical protein